ncbi:hypothetical protein H4R33_003686 [Dimargaris cristalligena]|nr:hypothetical protein H4R33_003686 [Dimargaris cristalligena]
MTPVAVARTASAPMATPKEKIQKTIVIEGVTVAVVQRGNQTIYKLADNASVSSLPPHIRQSVIEQLKKLHAASNPPATPPPPSQAQPSPASGSLASILASQIAHRFPQDSPSSRAVTPPPASSSSSSSSGGGGGGGTPQGGAPSLPSASAAGGLTTSTSKNSSMVGSGSNPPATPRNSDTLQYAIMHCRDPSELKKLKAALQAEQAMEGNQAVPEGNSTPLQRVLPALSVSHSSPLGAKSNPRKRLHSSPALRPTDDGPPIQSQSKHNPDKPPPSLAARQATPPGIRRRLHSRSQAPVPIRKSTTQTESSTPLTNRKVSAQRKSLAPAPPSDPIPDASYWQQVAPLTQLIDQFTLSRATEANPSDHPSTAEGSPVRRDPPYTTQERVLAYRRECRARKPKPRKSKTPVFSTPYPVKLPSAVLNHREKTIRQMRLAYTRDLSRLLALNVESPFSSLDDAIQNLLPFHLYQYPADSDIIPAGTEPPLGTTNGSKSDVIGPVLNPSQTVPQHPPPSTSGATTESTSAPPPEPKLKKVLKLSAGAQSIFQRYHNLVTSGQSKPFPPAFTVPCTILNQPLSHSYSFIPPTHFSTDPDATSHTDTSGHAKTSEPTTCPMVPPPTQVNLKYIEAPVPVAELYCIDKLLTEALREDLPS